LKRVWLKSEQDCLKMMKDIDAEGHSLLIKILETNSGPEACELLNIWYKRSFVRA
jgi:hypothetical protein